MQQERLLWVFGNSALAEGYCLNVGRLCQCSAVSLVVCNADRAARLSLKAKGKAQLLATSFACAALLHAELKVSGPNCVSCNPSCWACLIRPVLTAT